VCNFDLIVVAIGVITSYVVTMATPDACLLFSVVEDEVSSPRIRDVTVWRHLVASSSDLVPFQWDFMVVNDLERLLERRYKKSRSLK